MPPPPHTLAYILPGGAFFQFAELVVAYDGRRINTLPERTVRNTGILAVKFVKHLVGSGHMWKAWPARPAGIGWQLRGE
jgi:hypothetical protein